MSLVYWHKKAKKSNKESALLRLDSTSLLQQWFQSARLVQALEVRVAADMLLLDVDVGNGALAGDLLESILHGGAVG